MLQVRPGSIREYGWPCQAGAPLPWEGWGGAEPSAGSPAKPAPAPALPVAMAPTPAPALPLLQPTHRRPSSLSPNLPDSKRRRSAKKVWFAQPRPAAQLNSCPSDHIMADHILENCKTITVQGGNIGVSISGEKPSIVVAVKPEGPGYLAGVRVNQIIAKVNNEQVLHSASLTEVIEKVQTALQLDNSVSLKMMHVRRYRLLFPLGAPELSGAVKAIEKDAR